MKHFFLIAFFVCLSCNAQTPVKPLFGKGGSNISGAYYKDVDNDFNKFEGTWIYSSGNTSLKIVFQKKEQVYIDEYNAYYDVIIGEYQYIENGQEKVNTLSILSSPSENPYYHNIGGYIIMKKMSAPICSECGDNERRILLNFCDPMRPGIQEGLSGSLTVKKADSNNISKIKIILKQTGSVITDEFETPTHNAFNVPWGEYILIKQP